MHTTNSPTPHSPLPPRHSRRRRDGSVLVAVLAIILLLSFIVTRFMSEAVEDLEYRAIFNEPVEVRSFAYSMLEVALATIHEVALIDESKLYAPEQGWADPIGYAGIDIPDGWEVQIEIRDESGQLPINTMDEAMLNSMLEESFDFDFGTARELSSMLLDWIDPDDTRRLNGAESEDYLRRNPPYRAANAPLQSLEELRLLEVWEDEFFDGDGRPNELFHQLVRMVSVIHSGPANLNSSSREVLDLLAQQGGFDGDHLFDGLHDLPYLKELPESAGSANSGVEVRLLRVTVSLWRGEVPYTVSALVEPAFKAEVDAGGAPPRAPPTKPPQKPAQPASSKPSPIPLKSSNSPNTPKVGPAARPPVIRH